MKTTTVARRGASVLQRQKFTAFLMIRKQLFFYHSLPLDWEGFPRSAHGYLTKLHIAISIKRFDNIGKNRATNPRAFLHCLGTWPYNPGNPKCISVRSQTQVFGWWQIRRNPRDNECDESCVSNFFQTYQQHVQVGNLCEKDIICIGRFGGPLKYDQFIEAANKVTWITDCSGVLFFPSPKRWTNRLPTQPCHAQPRKTFLDSSNSTSTRDSDQ